MNVVPLMGTWIEIPYRIRQNTAPPVVPLMGTWIEIAIAKHLCAYLLRRPPHGDVD